MNITRLAGWLLVLFTLFYAGVTLVDYIPDYAAAGQIGEKAEDYGLQTNATNLRFQMGGEFAIDIIVIGLLALAGWWLVTQEVQQYAWFGIIMLFTVFSIVIRTTPVLPLNVGKLSAGGAFYGAQTQVIVTGFPAELLVPITKKQTIRPAIVMQPNSQTVQVVSLDLGDPVGGSQFQNMSSFPVTITGIYMGTSTLALGRNLSTVPLIRVKSAVAQAVNVQAPTQ